MLFTLFVNQTRILNMLTFLTLYFFHIAMEPMIGQGSPGSYILETALTNAGIGTILFLIWHLTFKRTQKQFEFSLSQNQEQFETALKQVNEQHKESLEQYKESLELNQKTTDRMLEIMRMEMEHKQLLAGILSEIKTSMKYHMKSHGATNE